MDFAQHSVSHRRTLAAVVLTLLALLAPVPAAWAHDSLVEMSPAEGATLEVAPEAIELTFTNPPIELGSEISVAGEDGTDWADGAVQIVGDTATQPLEPGAPAGEYTVTWRVVSSDSHPIEGVYTYTTSSAADPSPAATSGGSTPAATSGGSTPAAGQEAGPADPLAEATSEAQSEQDLDEAATVFPTMFVAIMIGVLVIIVIVIAVLARRRLGRATQDEEA